MSFGRKKLFAALEAGDLDGGLAVVEPAEADVAAADAMTDVVESDSQVNEEAIGIESLALSIEEAIDDAEQAEEVVEQVADVAEMPVEETAETADQGEGLDEGEAVLAEEAFRLVFRKLGGSVTKTRIVPGMESFKSSNSRRTATRVALENAMDTIKAVWERIIAAIKSLWDKIKGFFKKLFDANLNLEKAAKALKEKVKAIKNKNTKDSASKFQDSGLHGQFVVEGSIDSGVVKGFLNNHQQYMNGFAGVPAAVDKINLDKKKTVEASIAAAAVLKDYVKVFNNSKVESALGQTKEFDETFKGDKVLIGGKVVEVQVRIDEKEVDGEKVLEHSLSSSFVDGEDKPTSTENNVTIASSAELVNICDLVAQFAKDNGKLVTNIEKTKKSVDKVLNEIEKKIVNGVTVSKGKRDSSDDSITAAREDNAIFRKLVNSITVSSGTFGSGLASLNVRAGKAALSYVSKCAAQYV